MKVEYAIYRVKHCNGNIVLDRLYDHYGYDTYDINMMHSLLDLEYRQKHWCVPGCLTEFEIREVI